MYNKLPYLCSVLIFHIYCCLFWLKQLLIFHKESISPTFYEHLIRWYSCAKKYRPKYMYKRNVCKIFVQKAVRKILVKLTKVLLWYQLIAITRLLFCENFFIHYELIFVKVTDKFQCCFTPYFLLSLAQPSLDPYQATT